MNWEIEFYRKENGFSDVEVFLDNIEDKKLKAKVLRDIQILGEFGPELTMPQVKSMGEGIWELRTKQSSNIARVFYFFWTGKEIILLNGFLKKTQKTPVAELKKAKKYKEDHIRRFGE